MTLTVVFSPVLVAARRTKEKLSTDGNAHLSCALSGGMLSVTLTRAKLAELAKPLIDKTLAVVKRFKGLLRQRFHLDAL